MHITDVAIIGGGIGGLMAAYRLLGGNSSLKIIMIEKGRPLEERSCPMITQKAQSCIGCKYCAIMEGMAGAGAFSDGKYVISTEYGGWLTDFLDEKTVLDYIEQADSILVGFGAPEDRYLPSDELKRLCLKHDLHMQAGGAQAPWNRRQLRDHEAHGSKGSFKYRNTDKNGSDRRRQSFA